MHAVLSLIYQVSPLNTANRTEVEMLTKHIILIKLPRETPTVPDVPDDGHVVHTGLVTVSQLLEAHLRLPVHRVAALGLNLPLSL